MSLAHSTVKKCQKFGKKWRKTYFQLAHFSTVLPKPDLSHWLNRYIFWNNIFQILEILFDFYFYTLFSTNKSVSTLGVPLQEKKKVVVARKWSPPLPMWWCPLCFWKPGIFQKNDFPSLFFWGIITCGGRGSMTRTIYSIFTLKKGFLN